MANRVLDTQRAASGNRILDAQINSGATLVSLTDSAALTDALNTAAILPLSDSLTGSDGLAIAAASPLTDTVTGTSSLSILVSVSMADSVSGSNSLSTAIPGTTLLPNAKYLSAGIIRRNRISAGL